MVKLSGKNALIYQQRAWTFRINTMCAWPCKLRTGDLGALTIKSAVNEFVLN